jgi:general secretion pathway protein D
VTSFSNGAANILDLAGGLYADRLDQTTTVINGATVTTSTTSATADLLRQNAAQAALAARGGIAGWATSLGGSGFFGTLIDAVRADSNSNVLSTPHIVTNDNVPASILFGKEIPVATGEALSNSLAGAFRTIQRQNVGIELDVTPQINAGQAVRLDLRQQVSSVAGPVSSSNGELVVNKREIRTTVTVGDGEIIALGGLLDDAERRTLEKVPLLGDVPLLGELFKSRSKSHVKTNLMVFIRPTILRDGAGRGADGPADGGGARRAGGVRAGAGALDRRTGGRLPGRAPGTALRPAAAQPGDAVIAPTRPASGGQSDGATTMMLGQDSAHWQPDYTVARDVGVLVEGSGPGGVALVLREGASALALLEVRRLAGPIASWRRVAPPAFEALLAQVYADGAMAAAEDLVRGDTLSAGFDLPSAEDLLGSTDDAPVIRLINGLLAEGLRQGASDIHLEPYEQALVVRLRRDGQLAEILRLPAHVAPLLVSRIKVMARLDIAERRLPQDGRMALDLAGRLVDVRVSTLPSRAGSGSCCACWTRRAPGSIWPRWGWMARPRRCCIAPWPSPTASCWSPAPPVRARPPRSMPRSDGSTMARAIS